MRNVELRGIFLESNLEASDLLWTECLSLLKIHMLKSYAPKCDGIRSGL